MNLDEEESIRAVMILEILGKPPEHLVETLEKLITAIGNEKNVEVKDKKINKPMEMEKQKGFYTNFAEVEVEVKNILYLVMLMFKYMPAHIEIISPENIKLSNNNLGEMLSELVRRLHGYDEVARVIQMEKKILEKKLKTLLEEKEDKSKKEEKK